MCHSLVSTSQLCAAINAQVVLRHIKFCNNFTKENIFCYLWLIRRPRRSKLGLGEFSFGRHEYISRNNVLQLEGWRDRSHIRAPPMPDLGNFPGKHFVFPCISFHKWNSNQFFEVRQGMEEFLKITVPTSHLVKLSASNIFSGTQKSNKRIRC